MINLNFIEIIFQNAKVFKIRYNFLNKICLGVYTRVYVLLLLLIFKRVKFLINLANSESSYILMTMMHNVIYDIVMTS